MTSTSLSIDSVYEEKGFPVKSGKDALGQGVKNEARILGKVILDTWRFILGYIAKYRWILFRGSFPQSFPDFTEFGKGSAYLGSTKRKKPPPQRGQERQLKQNNSQASDNRFSMTSTSLSIDSVCE